MIQFKKKIGLPRRILGHVARVAGITAFLTVGAAGVALAADYERNDNDTKPGVVGTTVGTWSPTQIRPGAIDQNDGPVGNRNNNVAVGANSMAAVISNRLGAAGNATFDARADRAYREAGRILDSAPVDGLKNPALFSNGYTAAIYLDTTVTFDAAAANTDNVNKIVVDGNVTPERMPPAAGGTGTGFDGLNYLPDGTYGTHLYSNDGAHFMANSLVAFNAQSMSVDVDRNALGDRHVVVMDGKHSATGYIGANSALYVANALVNTDITVMKDFDGGITGDGGNWSQKLEFSNRMFNKNSSIDRDEYLNTGDIVVRTELDSAANTFTGISSGGASMVDGLFNGSLNDINSANAGIMYVSRATDQMFADRYAGTSTNAAKAIESIGQLGSIAGVQFTSFDISQNFADLMLGRTNTDCPTCLEPGSFNLWATPYYNFLDMDGFKSGGFGGKVDSKYGGAVIGGEYTATENLRLGLAFTVGGGDTETKGTFMKAESDFDFWGLGLYGTYSQDRLSVTGDLGYTQTDHELKQRIDPNMGMGNLRGDVDLSAFTLGLMAQYCLTDTDSNLDIVPHVGIRYTSLKTDSYSVHSRGFGRVSRVDSERQNIWTFPIGVTFTGNVDTATGWTIKPMADLGVIFAAGDTDADSRARINGLNYGGHFNSEVIDDITFNGVFGLGAASGDGFKARLDYNLKASENLTSHGVSATVGWEW